ncbi:MAG TPA: Hsp20/alpha crystallin family protein [Thermodesulfovibrionales bacterium]|jgi:HSP20 family protein|nr:Hsp20/alpha crystallin family protein [Thermodesulfovibrionales bacterium]
MAIRNLVPFGKKGVPVRREEESPFALLRREMDTLFDNFFRGFDMEPFEGRFGAFSPRVDVTEKDKEIKVSAELPGMDEKDINVSIHDNMLTIEGEKKEEKEDKGKDYYRIERSYGSFSRTIPLPLEVETDKVEATFKKGVLVVTLPKTAKAVAETKKIAVTTD